MKPPPFIVRTARRLLVAGVAALALVWAAGRTLEQQRFGPDAAAARERVAQRMTAVLTELETEFSTATARLVVSAADLRQAAAGEPGPQRRLFDAVTQATAGGRAGLSVTIYGTTPVPLAWMGRPVDTSNPDPRITGPAAMFLAPDALGLRLVRVHPLLDPASPALRIGTIVLQLPLARAEADGRYVLPTGIVDASIRPRYEGATSADRDEVPMRSSDGSVLGTIEVSPAALDAAHQRFADRVRAGLLGVGVLWLLLATGPLLDWRRVTRRTEVGVLTTAGVAVLLLGAYLLAEAALAVVRPFPIVPSPLTGVGSAAFFSSSWHFLVSSLLLAGFASLAASSFEGWRLARRAAGRPWTSSQVVPLVVTQVAAGLLVGVLVLAYQAFIRYGVAATPIDILHFSLRPWDWSRLAMLTGVIVLNASVASVGIVLLRLAVSPWAVSQLPMGARLLVVLAWLAGPAALVGLPRTEHWAPAVPTLLALSFIAVMAWRLPRIRAVLRNASQATRLLALVLGLILPSLAFYPSLVDAAGRSRRQLVETRYAPEVLGQRLTLQAYLAEALADIDRIGALDELARAAEPSAQGAPPSEAAYGIWSRTALARLRLTSSIELYNEQGAPVSRFALNLPDIVGVSPPAEAAGCAWDVFEEVSPFFAEERRLLHAGRGLCRTDAQGRFRRVGEVVVHVMLDYANLSFVAIQSPYLALLRPDEPVSDPALLTPVALSVYGWSGKSLYASESRSWPLDDATFDRAAGSREPFWTVLDRDGRPADAYVVNDRGAIYVLSTWSLTPLDHLLVVAELVSLAFLVFVVGVLAGLLYGQVAARTPTSGRALLREVRASFYRKLFLAFVAAAVVPVVALAFVARTYFASMLLTDIEMEATRTVYAASRVVEDFGSLSQRGFAELSTIDDNIVVWLSRVLAQDINIYDGPGLLASSERNLFASGLLSTRTPGDAYRAVELDGRPSFVGRETVGPVEYLIAAAPVRVRGVEAILTVPLTSRQREIETQIAELDRRVLLAALLFVMLGAGIGYSMAERIADPVNRLMRATRRIARGDLDARVVATSSDELRRLVEAFNGMAEDLRQQRAELERSNRLAAWADMARQVAHDIKNPLTPIQLNAEHLQRVHADRGRPLGPLVDDCVASILGQVRLLRQISAEFSSFASSPQPRPAVEDLAALVDGIVEPYRAGLAGRVSFELDVAADLPRVWVDRLLLSRALTNIIENALHAMAQGGRIRFALAPTDGQSRVRLSVADTGLGMTPEAQARIFEPYFSTKTTGTGLGLTIAKRNIEASGGSIEVQSASGVGTTVTLTLPTAPEAR
jgi:signal transduction histidine kinase